MVMTHLSLSFVASPAECGGSAAAGVVETTSMGHSKLVPGSLSLQGHKAGTCGEAQTLARVQPLKLSDEWSSGSVSGLIRA